MGFTLPSTSTTCSGNAVNRVAAYGQAKLANLLFTYEPQRRLGEAAIHHVAAHPGGSNTELIATCRDSIRPTLLCSAAFSQSPEMGARQSAPPPIHHAGRALRPGWFGERGHPRWSNPARSPTTKICSAAWTVSEESLASASESERPIMVGWPVQEHQRVVAEMMRACRPITVPPTQVMSGPGRRRGRTAAAAGFSTTLLKRRTKNELRLVVPSCHGEATINTHL